MKPFTIIANNCWSNKVYEHLNVPYQTPFINVFFHPDCYLRLLHHPYYYLTRHPTFIKESEYDEINRMRAEQQTSYPIALLGDIEIQCLHFKSEEEFAKTWARRLARLEPDKSKWFVKFSDEYGCTPSQLERFDALPYPNKVCYTSKPMPHLKSAVHIPGGDEVSFQDQTDNRHFDAIKWVTQ